MLYSIVVLLHTFVVHAHTFIPGWLFIALPTLLFGMPYYHVPGPRSYVDTTFPVPHCGYYHDLYYHLDSRYNDVKA